MKLGIISDTHDYLPNIKKAIDLFRLQGIHTVLHGGDFCSPSAVPLFEGLDLHTVFGNNDGDHYRILQKMEQIKGTHHGEFARLSFDGKRIALYHGTQEDITEALIKCGLYDLVVAGHTHEVHNRWEGQTLFLNPGSTHIGEDKATVAIYDTESGEAVIAEL